MFHVCSFTCDLFAIIATLWFLENARKKREAEIQRKQFQLSLLLILIHLHFCPMLRQGCQVEDSKANGRCTSNRKSVIGAKASDGQRYHNGPNPQPPVMMSVSLSTLSTNTVRVDDFKNYLLSKHCS